MSEEITRMPAVALRGMTILPSMIVHFDVSRDKSIKAIEQAMTADQKLFVVTQRDPEASDIWTPKLQRSRMSKIRIIREKAMKSDSRR